MVDQGRALKGSFLRQQRQVRKTMDTSNGENAEDATTAEKRVKKDLTVVHMSERESWHYHVVK